MILHRYGHRGSVAFPDEVWIDFDALPTVIAVHGKNGAGKTTLLDNITTPWYLSMPFRPGPLHKHFATKGFNDLTWSLEPGGPRYRSRINVDPETERTEASLFLADGGPALAGPLSTSYLKKIRDLGVLPLDVFLSTAYTVQPSSTTKKNAFSFLVADRSERREIFAELLGLKAYAIREAYAKDRIKGLDTKIVGNTGLVRQLEQDALKAPAAAEKAAGLTERLRAATTARDGHRDRLEGLRAASTEARARAAAIAPLKSQRDVLTAESTALKGKLDTAVKALADAKRDIADAERVQDAPARKEALVAQRASLLPLSAQVASLEKEVGELEVESLEIRQNLLQDEGLLAEEESILAAVERHAKVLGEISVLDVEIEHETTLDAEAASAYRDWQQARRTLDEKQAEVERLELQVSTTDLVPCKGQEAFAGCQFLGQAAIAKEALPGARAALDVLSEQVSPGTLRTEPVPAAPALKARRSNLVIDRDNLAPQVSKQVELASARSRVDAYRDRSVRVRTALDDKRRDRDALRTQVETLPAIEAALREIEPKLAIAAKLMPARAAHVQADATVAEVTEGLVAKGATMVRIEKELKGLDEAQAAVNQAEVQITALSAELRNSQDAISQLERELGTAQGEVARLEESQKTLERLRTEMAPMQSDLDDWALIARSQGATGIPALLVDRAVPEISERSTEMLKECLGERLFTIALITQKPDAKEKKLLETLECVVTRDGKPMDIELLSGGEGVLASEALSIAIGLYNADRAGRRAYTLFRDEVGAALDIDRAPAYTRLLARAAKLGGFNQVLFVTHHERALNLADARLEIANGKITVS